MSEIYEVLSPGGHEAMATSIFTYIKNYIDTHGPGSKVDRAGDTMTGALSMAGQDICLKTSDSSSDDSGDIVWFYGNGQEKSRIWTANDYTAASGPNYRVYKKDGTSLASGRLLISTGDTMTGSLTFNNVNNAICYNGQYASYPMIKFIDGNDVNGNGVSIGGGGAVCIGGGESSSVLAQQLSSGGSEVLYLGNDGNVDIFSNLQNGWASRRHVAFNTNGSLVFDDTAAANIIVPPRSISYIQGNNGNAGIYAKKTLNTDQWYPVVCMDTKAGGSWAIGNYNNEYLQFSYATKANRDSGTNSTSIVNLRNTAGTIALTSEAIKSISRSGTTFTATRADGTTFTFTQQDNNTTYSAGTAMSLSGTTFNHQNYGSAGTAGTSSATSGLSISIPYLTTNAQGHVTGKGVHTHTVNGVLYWKWVTRNSMAQSNRLDYWTIGSFPAKSGYSRAVIAMQISNRDVYPSHYDFNGNDVRIYTKTLEAGTQNFNAELLCVYLKDTDKW